jgi:hypothetical protein
MVTPSRPSRLPIGGGHVQRSSHALRRVAGACLATAIASCLALVALASAQGGSGGPQQSITVTARGSAATVTGAEDLRPGPVRVTFRAAGRGETDALLLRLKPGVEITDVLRYLRRVDSVPVDLVSVETAGSVGPGRPFRTSVDLPPGSYVAAALGERTRGLGDYAAFEVGGEPAGGSLPRADSSIQMYDYGFRVPRKIDGDGTLRIENIGRNEHFIIGIRLNPGANPAAVKRQLIATGNFQGPPPGELVSFISVVSPKTTNVIEADLEPGVYLLACSYADRASAGHDHTTFGMVRQATVR